MIDKTPQIEKIKDQDTRDSITKIFEEALGNLIEFSSAPSLSDMESNTIGFYGTDVYIKTKTGIGIKLTGASF